MEEIALSEKFDDLITVRCWSTQKKRWEIMAYDAGVSLSDYIRAMLVQKEREYRGKK